MRLLATLFMSLILATPAIAQEINVVISGKQGGNSYLRTMATAEFLESKGYTVNLIKMFNSKKAYNWFKQSTEPTVMFFTNTLWAEVSNDPIPAENLAFIESETYLYVCGDTSTSDVVNLSWRSDHGPRLPSFVQEFWGKDVVKVPYNSSGAEIEALLAGDTNLTFINQRSAKKLVANGVSCPYYTGTEFDADTNSKPLRNETENSQAKLAINRFHMLKNVDDALVATLKTIIDTPESVKGVPVFANQSLNQDEVAEYVNESITNWR